MCDEQGLHVHLDVVVAGGGDTRSVVEFALDRRKRHIDSKGRDKGKGALVFLDADRLSRDRAANRDPETVTGRESLRLVYLTPNLEGLLVRLRSGCETQLTAADNTTKRLLRLWPEYRKPMPARVLRSRFSLAGLRSGAQYDRHLSRRHEPSGPLVAGLADRRIRSAVSWILHSDGDDHKGLL